MAQKFFSAEWAKDALEVERAASDQIYKRFKNPAGFTHVLALEVADHPGVVTHIQYDQGRSVTWTTDLFDEDQVWARFSANLDAWRAAAEGKAKASNLVMAGRIKLTKGAMKDALENAAPFDRLVQTFGGVETNWEI
ncbi:SCP2 sterol-binding domain-containing protein [Mycobacterium paraintracellulare]|uniref:SCP2 sterol-binding domain-containing protein n=1 Tax=Mycobacterium paraintracellulare TaxID=1138383 RepID=UPI001915FF84|nr:SCP2 sterol-binding domain-containing protein [Mycobacterium paraintracellulare]